MYYNFHWHNFKCRRRWKGDALRKQWLLVVLFFGAKRKIVFATIFIKSNNKINIEDKPFLLSACMLYPTKCLILSFLFCLLIHHFMAGHSFNSSKCETKLHFVRFTTKALCSMQCIVCNKSNRIKCFIITNVIKMNNSNIMWVTNWLILLHFQLKYIDWYLENELFQTRSKRQWQKWKSWNEFNWMFIQKLKLFFEFTILI